MQIDAVSWDWALTRGGVWSGRGSGPVEQGGGWWRVLLHRNQGGGGGVRDRCGARKPSRRPRGKQGQAEDLVGSGDVHSTEQGAPEQGIEENFLLKQ